MWLLDNRYEVVPKKEYLKEILESEISAHKKNVKFLTEVLADEKESLDDKIKKLEGL